jgi:Putative Ig domain
VTEACRHVEQKSSIWSGDSPLCSSAGPLTITFTELGTATVDVPYSEMMAGKGGTAPYTWTGTGLPPGLALATDGTLSGSPTADDAFQFTATLTATGQSVSDVVDIAVHAQKTPLAVTTTSLPEGAVGSTYSVDLRPSGGTTPYTWTAAGLPSGLTVSANGTVSGIPATLGTK